MAGGAGVLWKGVDLQKGHQIVMVCAIHGRKRERHGLSLEEAFERTPCPAVGSGFSPATRHRCKVAYDRQGLKVSAMRPNSGALMARAWAKVSPRSSP